MKKVNRYFLSIFTCLLFVVSCATYNTKILSGEVTEVSKYGNVTTSITKVAFEDAGYELGDIVYVVVDDKVVLQAPYGSGYPNVDTGELIVLSSDGTNISVAINMGNFASTYNAKLGTEIKFMLSKKAGYLEEYRLRSVETKRTNNRSDYSSDEVFANFRMVQNGKIKSNRLYRSSNPVNPEIGRNLYSDRLIRKVGVKTAMNLADSYEELTSYPSYKTSYYSTIDVIPLNMTVDFTSDDFNKKLNRGLTFLSTHNTPYLVHCTEGKDRAGFVNALLECLCGASADEVIKDYMITYENYYFVEKDSDVYNSIAKSNINKMLMTITDLKSIDEVKKADLSVYARKYLKDKVELNDSTINTLISKLCD